MNALFTRRIAARVVGYGLALVVLTGCDKIKGMLQKDQGADAAVAVVDAGPVVAAATEDAGAADAAAAPTTTTQVATGDDLPPPDAEESKANRDIGFGNYKDELDKLEKEFDKAASTAKK